MTSPRRPRRLLTAWPAFGLAAWLAASAGTAAATEPTDAQRRALLQQKARLVEQLLGSSRAADVGASRDAQRLDHLARARSVLADGRSAIDAGDAGRAQAFIDEALRLTTAAFGSHGAQTREEAQRARNAELRQQVVTFRGALAAAPREERAGPPASLAQIDRLIADAERASAEARHDEAGQALSQAYQLATSTLSTMWAGRTITLERKFASPAEEYQHESERHASHESLVALAVRERQPDAAARAAIEQSLAHARAARERAQARAAAGDHGGGVALLEEATGHLLRALQAAGIPTFN